MTGNIMIIDDSSLDRKMIHQILKQRLQDINIVETEDGLDLADKLLLNNIHVCILDIMIPIKDGFQILKELKENTDLMDIPVIVCTGIDDKQAIEKALLLGAYDYFAKPLSEEAMKISLPLKVKNAISFMKRQKEIFYLSYHDKLTGLYNRRFCDIEMKRLDTQINLPISLIMGDVNGLKLANDSFGHELGDRLLIKIADILKSECRKDEIIARIGGDEFIIILPKTNIVDAEKLADRIKKRCSREKEDPIKPSISLGFSEKNHINQDIMSIYKAAEDKMYSSKLIESKSIRSAIISALRKTLHEHSHETAAHSNRLMELSHKLGKALLLSSDQRHNLKLLALLHDIGLTAVSEHIFTQNRILTPEEEALMQSHCEIGYRITNSLSDFSYISNDILSHHEHWDGSGYPQGLSGESIPLNARIISILDAYDTLTHGNLYQNPISTHESLEFIRAQAGKHFDPKIAEVFIKIMR